MIDLKVYWTVSIVLGALLWVALRWFDGPPKKLPYPFWQGVFGCSLFVGLVYAVDIFWLKWSLSSLVVVGVVGVVIVFFCHLPGVIVVWLLLSIFLNSRGKEAWFGDPDELDRDDLDSTSRGDLRWTDARRWLLRDIEDCGSRRAKTIGSAYARGRRSRAKNILGIAYANGRGVQQSYAKALYWFEGAALKGYAQAQANLGMMYEKGLGVEKDYSRAIKWYSKALVQGFKPAKEKLIELGKASSVVKP